MQWSDVAHLVADAAPTIGEKLAGVSGQAVGMMIAAAINCSIDPATVADTITNDASAMDKIKTLETTHSAFLGLLSKVKNISKIEANLIIELLEHKDASTGSTESETPKTTES